MIIQKKIVSASCIFLFESVGTWTKGAFLFQVFFLLCSLHNFDTKSVDWWTSNENYFDFINSFYPIPFKFLTKTCGKVDKQWKNIQPYMFYCLIVWTGGPVMKIMKKIVSTSCIFLFASVDMWTKRCLSISCFLSVMYSSQFWQKSVDRWTNNENYEKSFNLLYFITWKCGLVNK